MDLVLNKLRYNLNQERINTHYLSEFTDYLAISLILFFNNNKNNNCNKNMLINFKFSRNYNEVKSIKILILFAKLIKIIEPKN